MSRWARFLQQVAVGFALLASALLIHMLSLPQDDGAKRMKLVLGLALLLYMLALLAAVPVGIYAVARRVPVAEVGWLIAAVVVPVIMYLVVILWTGPGF